MAPSTITLSELHDVIQIVMGWDNSHMYHFKINGLFYDQDGDMADPADDVVLGDVLSLKNPFLYEYDFGDSWLHQLVVESVDHVPLKKYSSLEPSLAGRNYYCLDGARACPPEDCGGVYGYYEFYDAVNAPKDQERTEPNPWLDEWGYDDFDPEFFDIVKVNSHLPK
jgi:hypothetical protein